MSGKILQSTIIELAQMYGFRVAHFPSVLVTGRDGKPVWRTALAAGSKGFPDLVLVRRDDRVLFVEVKGDGDRLRPEQEAWLDDLRTVVEVHVWTPAELDSGEIQAVLQEHTG
jgi:hypothetical protein